MRIQASYDDTHSSAREPLPEKKTSTSTASGNIMMWVKLMGVAFIKVWSAVLACCFEEKGWGSFSLQLRK